MAQNYTNDPYSQSTVADTTLTAYENNDNCLKSSFSGAAYPSNTVAGQLHMRTGSHVGLRLRNAGNTAWMKVLEGDAEFQIPVYRNNTCEGWLINAASGDRVMVIRGGTTYTAGGTAAGSWAISGLSVPTGGSHTHTPTVGYALGDGGINDHYVLYWDQEENETYVHNDGSPRHTHTVTNASSSHSHPSVSSNATWRPAAYVFTLQYPDLG
jgi:hypothetical protein